MRPQLLQQSDEKGLCASSLSFRLRHFYNQSFKLIVRSVNNRLIWHLFRGLIPWSPRFDSTRKSMRNQCAHFLSLNDYTGSSAFTSTATNWFVSSQISAATSAQYANITWPVTAVRLNVTAYSSSPSVTMTVLQSG